ncbi:MAG: hemolysin family protein [Candidatus Kariarchaeaceae archaeon]|jgi:CBS domain containing-hemolysin-like protein
MEEVHLIDLALIFFLVFLNGFFVASEFAFVKVRNTQIEALVATGSRRAKRAQYIVTHLDRSMSSTQLGITLASIALGFVGEEFFHALFINGFEFLERTVGIEIQIPDATVSLLAFFAGYLVITFLHVVLGELAPKSVSIQFATRTALICAEPLYWFMRSTSWLLDFFVASSNFILRRFGIEPSPDEHHSSYTEDELKVIIRDSIAKGHMEPYESKLIFNILDFTDSNVKSILTPRIDLVALPSDCTVDDIFQLSIDSGYSRIPIYEDDLDNIIGFIHVKDVLIFANGGSDGKFLLSSVLRGVITVHEGKSLDDLLKEMQLKKTQVAVIVDEYGSVEGIVTIEDILEFIVGPIVDEFDSDESNAALQVSNGSIIAGGLVAIDAFNSLAEEEFGTVITSDDSSTLAGYVLELFESQIPEVGMETSDEDLHFKIISQEGNRIGEIEIKPVEKPEEEPEE